jgi:flagellar motor protein MotB
MFRRGNSQELRTGEEENPFLLSFSDLMASLLAIFILALVVMMIQLYLKQQQLKQDQEKIRVTLIELMDSLNEIQRTQEAIADALQGIGFREKNLEGMLEGIQKQLKKQGIEVIIAENGTVLRIPERALSFELSKFEIQNQYKRTADLIGLALLTALRQDVNRKLLDTVFVEGHTDSVPNRREMGNWGLSTYRAISLWLHWTENPGNYAALKSLKSAATSTARVEKPLISTSGYADTRPSAIGKPSPSYLLEESGNPADRRIDIRFTLASSEKKDLSALRGKLDHMRSKTSDLIRKLNAAQ